MGLDDLADMIFNLGHYRAISDRFCGSDTGASKSGGCSTLVTKLVAHVVDELSGPVDVHVAGAYQHDGKCNA